MNKPATFNDTNDWLAARVNVPTGMDSKALALSKNFQSKVRANCFFSAKVAEAHILDRLRKVSDSYSRGEINLSTARMKLKSFLGGADDVSDQEKPPLGVDLDAWKEAKKLSNLASTARLNLILTQNASMARAVGARQVSMDPDMLKRWPYFRYVPSIKKNKRPQHKRYYNLVLPKNDPFWDTHTPPSDFACGCSIEDVDAEEAKEFGGIDTAISETDGNTWKLNVNNKFVAVGPNESGYEFNIKEAFDTCEMSRIKNIPMRKSVFAKMREFTRKHDDVRFTCSTGTALKSSPIAKAGKQALKIPKATDRLTLGNLSQETSDALGIINDSPIVLEEGTTAFGLKHMRKRHKKELEDGTFVRALQETVFSSGVETHVVLTGKKMFCTVSNQKTGAFTTLHHYGQQDEWKVVSAHYPGKKHIETKGVIR
jgi:F like protein